MQPQSQQQQQSRHQMQVLIDEEAGETVQTVSRSIRMMPFILPVVGQQVSLVLGECDAGTSPSSFGQEFIRFGDSVR
jgi:hypothetical protein